MKIIAISRCAMAALAFSWAMASDLQAQDAYPVKPVRIVVPFAPGGSPDVVARIAQQKLVEAWGHPVIIDNRPGGKEIIGTQAMLAAPADGYTLLCMQTDIATNPTLIKNIPYDTLKEIAAVSPLARSFTALAANASVPVQTIADVVALARRTTLYVGGTGNGGSQEISTGLFNTVAGIKLQYVAYKASPQTMVDLFGNRVHFIFSNLATLGPPIKAGKLKGLAISGPRRSSNFPEMPTFAEAGLPDFEQVNWFGLFIRSGAPRDAIQSISSSIGRIQQTTDYAQQIAKTGLEAYYLPQPQFQTFFVNEIARFAKVIKAANIQGDPD